MVVSPLQLRRRPCHAHSPPPSITNGASHRHRHRRLFNDEEEFTLSPSLSPRIDLLSSTQPARSLKQLHEEERKRRRSCSSSSSNTDNDSVYTSCFDELPNCFEDAGYITVGISTEEEEEEEEEEEVEILVDKYQIHPVEAKPRDGVGSFENDFYTIEGHLLHLHNYHDNHHDCSYNYNDNNNHPTLEGSISPLPPYRPLRGSPFITIRTSSSSTTTTTTTTNISGDGSSTPRGAICGTTTSRGVTTSGGGTPPPPPTTRGGTTSDGGIATTCACGSSRGGGGTSSGGGIASTCGCGGTTTSRGHVVAPRPARTTREQQGMDQLWEIYNDASWRECPHAKHASAPRTTLAHVIGVSSQHTNNINDHLAGRRSTSPLAANLNLSTARAPHHHAHSSNMGHKSCNVNQSRSSPRLLTRSKSKALHGLWRAFKDISFTQCLPNPHNNA